MVTGFLVARSVTTISFPAALTDLMVAAICGKPPKTTLLRADFRAFGVLVPSTLTSSPGLISAKKLGLASLLLAESGE